MERLAHMQAQKKSRKQNGGGGGGATQIAVIPHSFNTLGQQQIYGSTVGKHLSKQQQTDCSWDTNLHQSYHQSQGYLPQEQVERPAARVPLLLIGRDVLVAQDPKHKHTHTIPQKYISNPPVSQHRNHISVTVSYLTRFWRSSLFPT